MKRFKYRGTYLFLLTFVLGLTSCAITQRGGSQPTSFAKDGKGVHKGRVTQAELQDDILRFESQFNARIESANQALETSANPKIRYRAALNRLIYSSNSLNIALGPSPEASLLDMVTFIDLSRDVLKKHWIPNVFGADGQHLDQAFTESRQQIWVIAERVLDPQQRSLLQSVISAWRNKHPEQINVETVRLSAFSTEAGAKTSGLDQNVGGLFASVQQSTQAVDSARLFAERALYYAERAPFLFRLQARLGASEIMDGAGLSLAQLPSPLRRERTIRDLLKEFQQTLLITRATLGEANLTVKSVSTLMGQLPDNPKVAHSATAAITQLTVLLKELNHLLSSAPYQKGVSQMAGIANQVDRESNRFLKRLAWLGTGLIAFFWTMFVISKLVYQYFLLKFFGSAKPASRDE
jgi:hypothetical protein